MSDEKANPDPEPSIAHDFGCTHDPCTCVAGAEWVPVLKDQWDRIAAVVRSMLDAWGDDVEDFDPTALAALTPDDIEAVQG